MHIENKVGEYGKVIIVTGMQYGSEGKGAITSYLAPVMSVGVRTGAANAGHTIYFKGKKFVMRQIPSVWINPLAKLVVGIGSIINLDILLKEIEIVNKIIPIKDRLYIDRNAFVVTQKQIDEEKKSNLGSRIGSTSALSGKGIGTATADKILREEECLQAKEVPELKPYLADTVDLINTQLDHDQFVLLEGTQGFKLSIEHGTFPFVTSRDVSATAIAASAGISTHQFEVEVVGVTRTYPIRVAGNSGPFAEDSEEVNWDYVTKRSGAKKYKIHITEKTSVTNRLRRIATFSKMDFEKAVQVNRPTEIVVTFADYLDWKVHEKEKITRSIDNFMEMIEDLSRGVPVTLLKTGPKTVIDFNHYRRNILRRLVD